MTKLKSRLEEYIKIYDSAVSDELCDLVLKEYKESGLWHKTAIQGGVDESARNCQRILISVPSVIGQNSGKRSFIDQQLFFSVEKIINKYNREFPTCLIDRDSGYELLRYETGQFYKQHVDSFAGEPRAVSCSLSLNDCYDGGEFAFSNRELLIKLPKGSALVFPSNFMYPHEVLPVTRGTRYAIVTWFI